MNKENFKNKLWIFSTVVILLLSYLFCRFYMFDFHGMKQWPTTLYIFSLTILIISLFLKSHFLSTATILGYLGGFIISLIFNSDGIDKAGTRTNNLWIIWAITLLTCIIVGIIIELVIHRKKFKRR